MSEKKYNCDNCGADRNYFEICPKCFSKKRPSVKDSEFVQENKNGS